MRLPVRLTSDSDMILTEQAPGHARASAVNTSDAFQKVEIYNAVIAKAVTELKRRFYDENSEYYLYLYLSYFYIIYLARNARIPRRGPFDANGTTVQIERGRFENSG